MAIEISIRQAVPRFPEFRFSHPVQWEIREGENWAVVGPNGAGKTLLADILQGRIALKEGKVEIAATEILSDKTVVRSMAFRDIYSLTDCRNMYYQQRWNSSDAEEAPLAGTLLKEFSLEKVNEYTRLFGIYDLLEKRIIALSSGELRKFLITRILMQEPRVLILDNPYIGLDACSRESLNEMLQEMARLKGLQTILLLCDPGDIPDWIDYVLPLKHRLCMPVKRREDFMTDKLLCRDLFPDPDKEEIQLLGRASGPTDYKIAVHMEDVCVRYGSRIILEKINWTVRKGEKWALLGKNGTGKSTLLSLICGDNPQGYANKLTLFDRRRGSGESIWDIKRRIGYLSPDMHTYYLQDIPCVDVVASGFFDSVGLYRKCTEEQRETALEWLKWFDALHLAERSFVKISYGEQRLVLLVRAFVKNPDLLILDEPLHGLDAGKKRLAGEIIRRFCEHQEKTLIYVTHYQNEIPDCVTHYKELS